MQEIIQNIDNESDAIPILYLQHFKKNSLFLRCVIRIMKCYFKKNKTPIENLVQIPIELLPLPPILKKRILYNMYIVFYIHHYIHCDLDDVNYFSYFIA